MLAKDILRSARFMLSDTNSTRWTDTRLLSLLTDALRDLALKTTLMQETIFIGISDQVVDYDLSSFAFRLDYIEYLDIKVPFKSFEEMDKLDAEWQLNTGTKPEYIVMNKQKQANFKLYPIVSNAENSNITYTSFFGIITYVTYGDILPILAAGYGDMSGLGPAAYLKVYYTRNHDDVTDINQVIYIDRMCKEPIAHYIAGRALRDNTDNQSRNMGNEELKFYYVLVEEHAIEKSKSNNNAPRETSYNPLGT